jgi:uncharacterized protein (DUF302 family)
MMNYGFSKIVALTFNQAVEKVTAELSKEGFGILTTIDVRETLKKKLNIEFSDYVILGACNPPLAHRALTAEEEIGLLLPCNVIVYRRSNQTVVSVFNPAVMTSVVENPSITPIADEVTTKLQRVIDAL